MLFSELLDWALSSYSFYFNYAFSIPTAVIALRMRRPFTIVWLAMVPFVGFSLQLFMLAYYDLLRRQRQP